MHVRQLCEVHWASREAGGGQDGADLFPDAGMVGLGRGALDGHPDLE